MRTNSSRKLKTILITIILILTIIPLLSNVMGASGDTSVTIDLTSDTVGLGETFDVNVYCVPGQPIKAFELKVLFNPSLLKANKVTLGNIFQGYYTFFKAGKINNNIGAIVDIYALILGEGTVSAPSNFVTISFTAKSLLGTSFLELSDVGVTNEEEYILIEVSDGTITIEDTGEEPPEPPEEPPGGDTGENHLPSRPLRPTGPTSVELGVEYAYSSSTYDIDEDQVKLMFDWGDGSYSEWSSFVDSNTTVTMSHSWDEASYYSVRVIAQDENGLYSSWSRPRYVRVMQTDSENPTEPPPEEPDNDTEDNNPPPSNGGNNPPSGNGGNPSQEDNRYNPPWEPLKPSGPTFVEKGISYNYSSSAIDIDDNKVMLKFDWGDGTVTGWSELVPSSKKVTMSHIFNSSSYCNVRVMALDETLLNSSWSEPLNVTILQNKSGEINPLANISITSNLSANQTIIFNASESFESDGEIILYEWDFGDGSNGSGISPSHIYKNPGIYTVTLVVTDSNGNTYSTTILVPIVSENKETLSENLGGGLIYYLLFVVTGFIIFLFAIFGLIFRDNIKSFIETRLYDNYLLSNLKIWYTKGMINRISSTIEKTKMSKSREIDYNSKIDRLLISKRKKKLLKFFHKNEFYNPVIENIEEIVDKVILVKACEEIDSF